MTYQIKTTAFNTDVIEWLQENVGDLLWSKPIIEWHGKGWHVANNADRVDGWYYVITVDDPRLAMITSLRWS